MMQNMPSPMMNPGQSPNNGMPQNGGVPSVEEMQNQGEQEPSNILAHMTPEEVDVCLGMMGLTKESPGIIDPDTGLVDLTPLEVVMRQPQVQDYISQTLGNSSKKMAEGGSAHPLITQQPQEIGRPIVPELEELREEGRGKDTELVIITEGLAQIFAEMNGGKTDINPTTGLPEYGFFKELLRIGAGVAGFVVGGPVGAAIGVAAAHKATGRSWGDSLKSGLLGFGLGTAFNFAAPMLGFPGATTTGGSWLGSKVPMLGSLDLVKAPMSPEQSFVNQARNSAGMEPPPSMGAEGQKGGFLSNLLSPGNLIPLAGAGYLAYKGAQDEKKQQKDYENRINDENESMRSKMGFDQKLGTKKPYELIPNEEPQSEEDIRLGKQRSHFIHVPNYSAGGAIKGIGKGQQDNIPKDIRKNSYIIDASTVSDIGDGSSEAGIRELNNYFSKIPLNYQKKEAHNGYMKAMLSPDEYEVEPEIVTAIGKGSNEKGAKILEQLIKKVRKQKRTSGEKLPPKSKPLGGYMKQMSMVEGR
jgi:hypothetical protein